MAESTEKKIRKFLQVGTIECMILCVVLAIVIGVLFITIGFWKTLLITALILLGLFIGGVQDKKAFLRGGIDKVAPQRAALDAKREELVQKIRETVKHEETEELEDEAEAAAEDVQEVVDATVEAAAEVQEAVEETVAEAQEEIEAKAEEISETAEEIVAEAKETEEKIEEAAEEIGEKIKDAAEEAAE